MIEDCRGFLEKHIFYPVMPDADSRAIRSTLISRIFDGPMGRMNLANLGIRWSSSGRGSSSANGLR
jgi:hypothetical protein